MLKIKARQLIDLFDETSWLKGDPTTRSHIIALASSEQIGVNEVATIIWFYLRTCENSGITLLSVRDHVIRKALS